MEAVLGLLLAGLAQGLAAGLTPGPLLALVFAQAVRHGARPALAVSVAPLLTDAPIVLAAVLLTVALPAWGLALLALIGGTYVLWLGIGTMREARADWSPISANGLTAHGSAMAALRKGTLTNLLSPHPYLFWSLVGVPALNAAMSAAGPAGMSGLLLGFFGGLVGSKAAVGLAAARGARFLGTGAHRLLLLFCGLALVGLGLVLAAGGVVSLRG